MTLRNLALLCFFVGAVPLLAYTFFSPGLAGAGMLGWLVLGVGVLTLGLVIRVAITRPSWWFLVAAQVVLLGLLLIATFGNSRLYIGT